MLMHSFNPVYLKTHESGELKRKIETAYERLKDCAMCPRNCYKNRLEGQLGDCKLGKNPDVSHFFASRGEEEVLSGRHGSGTIYLNGWVLPCHYCENYESSLSGERKETTVKELADAMLTLQKHACYNIHLINPSNQVPQILEALNIAIEAGLKIPLVYNTSGYDSIETIKLLEGIVDIYVSDFRFWNPEVSEKYCQVPQYQQIVRGVITEMHRQAGDLVINKDGIAEKGLLIRHLVLPGGVAGTSYIMHFLANEISKNTFVNIMDNYTPDEEATRFPELNFKLTFDEYKEAVKAAAEEGLTRGFQI